MTGPGSKPMPDRPHWFTPAGAKSVRATGDYLDRLPVGAVLAVPVRFGDDEEPVKLSIVKVSTDKFGVHTRAGFPARQLVGARVKRRRRRVQSAGPAGRPDKALPVPVPVSESTTGRVTFGAAVARIKEAR